jgi:hypothetical protein
MTGTLLSFTVVAVAVRALAGALSAFEMMTVRSAFGLVFVVACMWARPALQRKAPSRSYSG